MNIHIIRLALIGFFILLAAVAIFARSTHVSWSLFVYSSLGLLVSVGLAGIFFCQGWFRILLWVLSTPPFFVGLFTLVQGGIAEPFSASQLLGFCGFAFWPAFGCTTGEFVTRSRSTFGRIRKSEIIEPSAQKEE